MIIWRINNSAKYMQSDFCTIYLQIKIIKNLLIIIGELSTMQVDSGIKVKLVVAVRLIIAMRLVVVIKLRLIKIKNNNS